MATYKLIQDVEADDKLLGPLSFKQFIYALVSVFLLFISYVLYTHHAELLDIFTIPLALIGAFLAYPFGKDQPTEVWALARLNFLLKPRRRIWAQSGFKKLVTITVPKKMEISRTDGLSQTEVKSRLQALANTIDSRGWAIKNVGSDYQNPLSSAPESDRLISTSTIPSNVPDFDVPESEDLFDENANPVAQQMQQLLSDNASKRRQDLIDHLNDVRSDEMKANTRGVAISQANSKPDDLKLETTLKTAYVNGHSSLSNLHTLRNKTSLTDLGSPIEETPLAPPTPSTYSASPVIMNYSRRNDLDVSVIARQVNKAMPSSGAVEISITH